MSSYFPDAVDNKIRPSHSHEPTHSQFSSRGVGCKMNMNRDSLRAHDDRLHDASGLLFPSVRDILWDRHYLSRGVMVTVPDVLPVVYFSIDCLNELLTQLHANGGDGGVNISDGFGVGVPIVSTLHLDSDGIPADIASSFQQNPRVFRVQMTPTTVVGSAKKMAVSLPIKTCKGDSIDCYNNNSEGLVLNLAKSLLMSPEFTLKSVLRCNGWLCTATAPATLGLRLRCELILPNCSFQYKQLRPLPLLHTALVRALASPLAARDVVCEASNYIDSVGAFYGVRSPGSPNAPAAMASIFGYVTLNQTRKVVLLQEGDGNLGSIPIVGVWIRLPDSVPTAPAPCAAADPHSAPTPILSDFQLWAACVRFVHTAVIKDRALVASGTFLVVVVHRGCFYHYECTLMNGTLNIHSKNNENNHSPTSIASSAFSNQSQYQPQQQYSKFEFEVPLPSSGSVLTPVLAKFRRCYQNNNISVSTTIPSEQIQSDHLKCQSLPVSMGVNNDRQQQQQQQQHQQQQQRYYPAHDEVLEVSTLMPTPRSSLNLPSPTLYRGAAAVNSGDVWKSGNLSNHSNNINDDNSAVVMDCETGSTATEPSACRVEDNGHRLSTVSADRTDSAVTPPWDIYAPAAKALLITKDLQISALEREIKVMRRMLWKEYHGGEGNKTTTVSDATCTGHWLISAEEEEEEARIKSEICSIAVDENGKDGSGSEVKVPGKERWFSSSSEKEKTEEEQQRDGQRELNEKKGKEEEEEEEEEEIIHGNRSDDYGDGSDVLQERDKDGKDEENEVNEENSDAESESESPSYISHFDPPADCLLVEHLYQSGVVISEPSSICLPSESTVSIIHKENSLLSVHAGTKSKSNSAKADDSVVTCSVTTAFSNNDDHVCHHVGDNDLSPAGSDHYQDVQEENKQEEHTFDEEKDEEEKEEDSSSLLRTSLVYEYSNSADEVSTELLVDDICHLYRESESVINIELKYINLSKNSVV